MKRFLVFFFFLASLGNSALWAWPCCYRLELAGWWGNVDYLLLWRSKRFFPPLVTTGPDPVLGAPGTQILFGDEKLRRSPQSGVRGDIGVWLSPCIGGGGSVFVVGNEKIKFHADSNEFPILARPFFDPDGTPDAEIIAQPILNPSGNIDIHSTNSVAGGDIYGRYRFYYTNCFKFDILGGFMYSSLRDSLDIATHSQDSLLTITRRSDHFHAKNDYYAGLVGFSTEFRTCSWAAQFIGKVGLGNMVKHVDINGLTTTSSAVLGDSTFVGGLLALQSNIGNHSSGHFEVVPQFNANLQVKVWPNVWLTAGYIFLFWPEVLLSGEQVDLTVNTSQQDGGLLVGPSVPQFTPDNKSFTVQGFTLGISFLF